MKKLYIVANWKSNKTLLEAKSWLQEFSIFNYSREAGSRSAGQFSNKEIIICPPFTLLDFMNQYIEKNNLPFELGAQDISPFAEGAYTGAVNGKQIKEFAKCVIVGHSERRMNFGESNDDLENRVLQTVAHALVPIFCVGDEQMYIPEGITIVAFEPVSAIGTGNPDTPENADLMAQTIKEKNPGVKQVLYGGSVKADNVKSFTAMPNIDGVLVGGASLDPHEFSQIIKNA